MNTVSRISPVTDEQVARLVSAAALADLAGQIRSGRPDGPPGQAAGPVPPFPGAAPRGRRRRIAVPVAAVAAAAGVILAVVLAGPLAGSRNARSHPASPGAGIRPARLLSFTRHGRYIDVIIRNPLADPRRYRAEFRAHHLDITLSLVPVSPSLVGTVVYSGGSQHGGTITPLTARGRCLEASGTSQCPVGLRVPGATGAAPSSCSGGRPGRARSMSRRRRPPPRARSCTGCATGAGPSRPCWRCCAGGT